jgi:hypothetical protein
LCVLSATPLLPSNVDSENHIFLAVLGRRGLETGSRSPRVRARPTATTRAPPPRTRASGPRAIASASAPQRSAWKSSSICAARHAAPSERKPRDGECEQPRSGQRRHRRLAQIIFGFWFRTRACGSGCRLLPKQRQTRPNNQKRLRQILDHLSAMSRALPIEASWMGREAQFAYVRLTSTPAAGMRRVGVWRSGFRLSMSVAAPFVWRCLSGSAVAPFPHPPHR